jgi:exopolyphosphatase/guanosine-5'-triphosphate,3'-diphosphate pyrophosphatase
MKYAIAILSLLFVLTNAWADECLKNRAAFDIGSGGTKMVVATVDTCLQNVKQILAEKELAVGYKDDLDNSQGIFSEEIQKRGLDVLQQLKKIAQKYNPNEYVGVATSAFRKSKNGVELVNRIKEKLGIHVQIIPQRIEAILGFLAAYPQTGLDKKDILVWDIGGGSMQITMARDDDTFEVYEGKLASVSMKNMIIGALQGKSYQEVNSPNPMGEEIAAKAVNLAQYYAAIHVQIAIKEKVKNLTVLGIGGVHYYCARKQCVREGNTYTILDVEKTLKDRCKLTDDEIGGKYAATDVSNLALVLGFMRELEIEKIDTFKANMAHGILIYPKYWH